MPAKPEFHLRLEQEVDELNQKLDKLETFIELSPEFHDLDSEDRQHLKDQLGYMQSYEAVISTRLAKLDNAFKETNKDAN